MLAKFVSDFKMTNKSILYIYPEFTQFFQILALIICSYPYFLIVYFYCIFSITIYPPYTPLPPPAPSPIFVFLNFFIHQF